MRVVQVHNFYRSSAPSGEDEVVRAERELLRRNGIEVVEFERHNDTLDDGLSGSLRAALSNVWSADARRDLASVLRQHRPHLAHFHNTFPQISAAAYSACVAAGVPVVQTLHNFRMFCANGLLNRDGRPCESCITGGVLPGIVHGCYRDSRLATAGMSLAALVHRTLRTHAHHVDRFIALTEFARTKFIAAGVPAERIGVRGNSLATDPGAGNGAGGYALFVGRLTPEKGVATLIDAWQDYPGLELRIVGDGPLDATLRARAAGRAIRFVGRQPRGEVAKLMGEAAMVIIPSECYEGFPRVFVEALAAGTPVIVSRLGGLAELVREGSDGIAFRAGDSADLRGAVASLATDAPRREHMRGQARQRFTREFSPRRAFDSLLHEYSAAASLH